MGKEDFFDGNLISSVRIWLVLGLSGAAASFALFLWVPPDDPRYAFCLSRRVLELPCPGCGMVRAMSRLVRGEWSAVWHLHPVAPLLAAQLLGGWILAGLALSGRLKAPSIGVVNYLLLANLALLLGVWLVRLLTGTLPR